jgi:hypothetical protein
MTWVLDIKYNLNPIGIQTADGRHLIPSELFIVSMKLSRKQVTWKQVITQFSSSFLSSCSYPLIISPLLQTPDFPNL